MKIAELREVGCAIGREGMSKMAIKAVEDFDGSYKGAMELCGKLSVIAKMSTCDDYWNEQVFIGEQRQHFEIELIKDSTKTTRNKRLNFNHSKQML